jgi:hypothetical protein
MLQGGNPPGLKLAITRRHVATGDSYRSLMHGFRVAHNTISEIVRDVCEAIIAEYAEEIMQIHTTQVEWQHTADTFGSRWQFHHVLGALDGKHIQIRCPHNGGSMYFNNKGIILPHGPESPTSCLTRTDNQWIFCYFDWKICVTDSFPHL